MTASDMPRFLIRAGSAGDWMVWDRAARGPATLDNRKLSKLSRQAAETALAKLLSSEDRASAPSGVDQLLWAICAIGARSLAPVRQSDATGLGDEEVQAL
jgi:hypothetical protein